MVMFVSRPASTIVCTRLQSRMLAIGCIPAKLPTLSILVNTCDTNIRYVVR